MSDHSRGTYNQREWSRIERQLFWIRVTEGAIVAMLLVIIGLAAWGIF